MENRPHSRPASATKIHRAKAPASEIPETKPRMARALSSPDLPFQTLDKNVPSQGDIGSKRRTNLFPVRTAVVDKKPKSVKALCKILNFR